VREQKDAQEYLNVLFDRLESLLKPTSQKYLLQNVFGGKTCSIMRCKNCGNLRKNSEAFFNLSLEVKNQKDIYDGLQKIIKGENISDYQCEACNKRVELEKKVTIDKLPNLLIIHLQRIIFDFDTMRNQKLNDRVEFPEQLCLKEYMTDYVIKKDKLLEEKQKK
jgi:ubiquitin carboxyl-terminal hydrolase 34